MKTYSVEEIIKDVRISLDFDKSNDNLAFVNDTETLSLDAIIASKIVEAVERVHITAPVLLLEGSLSLPDDIYWEDGNDGVGWVQLPADFMRLVCFKMSDWNTIVRKAIGTDNPIYSRQRSRFKGVRGNPQKPVCVVAVRPAGRVLEFYSCKDNNATMNIGEYIPYPKIDEYGTIEICEPCYQAVIYTIAMLVSITLGENEKGNYFNELAKTSLI